MSDTNVTWWRRIDQDGPFSASAINTNRVLSAFPGRKQVMIFCQNITGTTPVSWTDIEENGGVWSAREADLIVEMKPAGFVYVLKDRFGPRLVLRSIWRHLTPSKPKPVMQLQAIDQMVRVTFQSDDRTIRTETMGSQLDSRSVVRTYNEWLDLLSTGDLAACAVMIAVHARATFWGNAPSTYRIDVGAWRPVP